MLQRIFVRRSNDSCNPKTTTFDNDQNQQRNNVLHGRMIEVIRVSDCMESAKVIMAQLTKIIYNKENYEKKKKNCNLKSCLVSVSVKQSQISVDNNTCGKGTGTEMFSSV